MQATGDRTQGSVALLLLGAGSGSRLGQPLPKALAEVDGRTLLAHALSIVVRSGSIHEIIVTAPVDRVAHFEEVAAAAVADAVIGKSGGGDRADRPAVRVVAGGVARSDSVAVALQLLSGKVGLVLVHDVARAFAPAALIDSVIAALRSNPHADAVVPALPVTDTIKLVDPVGGSARGAEPVLATLDRATLRAAQTPQGFRVAALESALRDEPARRDATDDADLVTRTGGVVVAIPGHATAFKITHPFDLLIAEALCADRKNNEHATATDSASSGSG